VVKFLAFIYELRFISNTASNCGGAMHRYHALFSAITNNNNNDCLIEHVNKDEWEDLECLSEACQAVITEGGLFTNTGVHEQGESEWRSENDREIKTVS